MANDYFKENKAKQQAKKDMLKNQAAYHQSALAKNEEWRMFGKMKNSASVAQVKGRAKGKVLRLWTSDKSVDGVEWTRNEFMKVISNVKSGYDPVYDKLSEMLSGIQEYDHFIMLSEYVKEIWDILHPIQVDNEIVSVNQE